MKSFQEIRISFLNPFVFFLLFSCASSHPMRPVESTNSVAPESQKLKLKDLEDLEAKNPKDPLLKLKLAKEYFCQGMRGQSLEALIWVKQFSEDPRLKEEASSLIKNFENQNRRECLSFESSSQYPKNFSLK